jgi:hypothetical protein
MANISINERSIFELIDLLFEYGRTLGMSRQQVIETLPSEIVELFNEREAEKRERKRKQPAGNWTVRRK